MQSDTVILKTIQGAGVCFSASQNKLWWTADADIDGDGGVNREHDKCWQSETALKLHGQSLDAQSVPFGVVPIGILNLVRGLGLGARLVCTNGRNAKRGEGVLGDLGPHDKIGELSPAFARLLGINPNSVSGGESRFVILYEVYLDVPAVVNGVTYQLQPL